MKIVGNIEKLVHRVEYGATIKISDHHQMNRAAVDDAEFVTIMMKDAAIVKTNDGERG